MRRKLATTCNQIDFSVSLTWVAKACKRCEFCGDEQTSIKLREIAYSIASIVSQNVLPSKIRTHFFLEIFVRLF